MENVELRLEGDKLTIEIDLAKDLKFTRAHGSILIASTYGNLQLWQDGKPHPKGIKLNLSCFRSLTGEEKARVKKALNESPYMKDLPHALDLR